MNNDDSIYINIVVEDDLSDAVLRRLLENSCQSYIVAHKYQKNGSGYIDKNIDKFNHAATAMPYFVLRDLDTHECAPVLLHRIAPPHPHPNFFLRIAKREVEAWLLADRNGCAQFMGVPLSKIPIDAESVDDPKRLIVSLAKKSRKPAIRGDIAPYPGSVARVGRAYNQRLIEFVKKTWNIETAARHADSLSRTIHALETFKPEL